MGNAVSPAVAAALGRCLALAAVGESPPGEPVISVPDLQYKELVQKLRSKGMQFYYETVENAEKIIPVRTWLLSNPTINTNGGAGNGAGPSGTEAKEDDDEEDEEDIEFAEIEEV
jgi:DNA (cytosine-5)-methyltransferase 1